MGFQDQICHEASNQADSTFSWSSFLELLCFHRYPDVHKNWHGHSWWSELWNFTKIKMFHRHFPQLPNCSRCSNMLEVRLRAASSMLGSSKNHRTTHNTQWFVPDWWWWYRSRFRAGPHHRLSSAATFSRCSKLLEFVLEQVRAGFTMIWTEARGAWYGL